MDDISSASTRSGPPADFHRAMRHKRRTVAKYNPITIRYVDLLEEVGHEAVVTPRGFAHFLSTLTDISATFSCYIRDVERPPTNSQGFTLSDGLWWYRIVNPGLRAIDSNGTETDMVSKGDWHALKTGADFDDLLDGAKAAGAWVDIEHAQQRARDHAARMIKQSQKLKLDIPDTLPQCMTKSGQNAPSKLEIEPQPDSELKPTPAPEPAQEIKPVTMAMFELFLESTLQPKLAGSDPVLEPDNAPEPSPEPATSSPDLAGQEPELEEEAAPEPTGQAEHESELDEETASETTPLPELEPEAEEETAPHPTPLPELEPDTEPEHTRPTPALERESPLLAPKPEPVPVPELATMLAQYAALRDEPSPFAIWEEYRWPPHVVDSALIYEIKREEEENEKRRKEAAQRSMVGQPESVVWTWYLVPYSVPCLVPCSVPRRFSV